MKTANEIIKNARAELIELIKDEIAMIDAYLQTGRKGLKTCNTEGIIIESDVLGTTPRLQVEVDNSYLDVEETTYEYREISAIILDEENIMSVEFSDDEGRPDYEISEDRLSVDELYTIASSLESTYNEFNFFKV